MVTPITKFHCLLAILIRQKIDESLESSIQISSIFSRNFEALEIFCQIVEILVEGDQTLDLTTPFVLELILDKVLHQLVAFPRQKATHYAILFLLVENHETSDNLIEDSLFGLG